MNIKSIINPLIFGREGIDDKLWKIRVSQTTEKGYTARVFLTNCILIKKVNRGYEDSLADLKLTFKLTLDGKIEYYKASITGRNNGPMQLKARNKARELFSELRLTN